MPKKPAYKNPALPTSARVADLVARMTLQEKVAQLNGAPPALKRLGVPAFKWGGECLHGLCNTGKSTCFPQTIGLAATFDPDLVQRVASATASEARAKFHNTLWHGPNGPRTTLNYWTPNINIFRDPRWGRGQETYGEDPFLTGLLASAFVKGLQGDHPKYLKVAACAKHFAVHSGPEHIRQKFDARATPKDLRETYFPAFKMLIDAGASSVMATYNRLNGEPCPGSKFLLQEVLRQQWGFTGFVTSDGGATDAIHKFHEFTKTPFETAVLCMNAGCDMELSGHPSYAELPAAIQQGLVTEKQIDDALTRILTVQFRLGIYDPPARNPYTKIKPSAVQCKKHLDLAYESALKSLVLLKNNGVLPLKPAIKTISVSGPNAADLQVLLGNFYRGASARLVSIFEGLVARAPEGTCITHMQGCFLEHPNAYPSTWHEGLAEWADVMVSVVGISPLMEGESGECIASTGDRASLELPPNQVEYLRSLRQACPGKPLILIVTGGSPVALANVQDLADAILFVWYPGEQGGLAVGDVLFGHASPSGRLPVTFPQAEADLPPFEDYSMLNRTYRYMKADSLYPFGFGLSYTTFKYGKIKLSKSKIKIPPAADPPIGNPSIGNRQSPTPVTTATITITNTGRVAADEAVQLYLTDDQASAPTPRYALKGLQRIHLRPKQSRTLTFPITAEMLFLITEDGRAVLEPGTFTISLAPAAPHARAQQLGAPTPATATLTLLP